jgi:hypothetical protein
VFPCTPFWGELRIAPCTAPGCLDPPAQPCCHQQCIPPTAFDCQLFLLVEISGQLIERPPRKRLGEWARSSQGVAMTSAPCSGGHGTGRPARGRSCKPSSPAAWKRWSHVRTVVAVRASSWTSAGTRLPISARRIRRAHSTARAGAVRARAHFSIAACSAAVNFFNLSAIAGLVGGFA